MPKKKKLPPRLIYPVLALSLIFNLYFLVHKYLPPVFPEEENLSFGRVKRIVDGDTFDLNTDQRVRLAGANAPEYPKSCFAQEAKDRLEELISGKNVRLEIAGTNNLNPQIAYVFLNDLLIDQTLVQEGLAQATNNNPKYDPKILSSEQQAQKLKKGIWSEKCQPRKECVIKGNYDKNNKTRVYHLPECYNYDGVVIKEEENDRWFCSEEEARKAGFVRSQDCPY